MSVLLAVATVLLVAMLLVCVCNLLTAPRLERIPPGRALPLVSVLVPARDEAENLRRTLPALRALAYGRLEILVLDDGSRDGTTRVVRDHARADPRVRLVTGTPLPRGWLGKPWACHQLARMSRGQVLIFCDADVWAEPGAVRRTLGVMEALDADAVTALPRQRAGHWAADAVVPLLTQLPVLALLPLALVPRSPRPSMAAGNGQWFALTRRAYRAVGGHQAVRGNVVEDVALARRVKGAGRRLAVVISTELLQAQTYSDLPGLRAGLRKNLYALTGGRPLPFALALGLYTLAMVYPLAVGLAYAVGALADLPFAFPWTSGATGDPGLAAVGSAGSSGSTPAGVLTPLFLLAGVRVSGMLALRHSPGSAILHPVAAALALFLAVDSALASARGRATWKGRPVTRISGRPGPGEWP